MASAMFSTAHKRATFFPGVKLFSSKHNVPKMLRNNTTSETFRKYRHNVCSRPTYRMCLAATKHNIVVDSTTEEGEEEEEEEEMLARPVTATFRRSLWAEDSFSSESHDQGEEEYAQEMELLKEKVRKMVIDEKKYTQSDKMVLIDTLERMDVAYHFQEEIEEQIRHIYYHYEERDRDGGDLFTTALYFRLFRQHGFGVSCSVFDKFKDEDNAFNEALCGDVEGLMSLYEASFLRFSEESSVLMDARDFATRCLNQAKPSLEEASSSPYLMAKVERALKQPLHWAIPKVEAHYYMSIYDKREATDEEALLLIRLAKLDFRVMQKMYKKEMNQVQKWWYEFDLVSKLPYARDCVVLCYFWAAGLNFEPKYSRSRIAAAKTLVMCTFLNDTYDSYATLDELQVFTDILQRWDSKDADKLPKYLKAVFHVLLTAYEEFEHETSLQGRSFSVGFVKEAVSGIASAYYKKATWLKGKEIPTFKDHVDYMGMTSGAHQLMSAFFMHVESASMAGFNWLMNKPPAVEEAALYCRYLNDASTYEREQERGQYPVAVDTYMEEKSASIQETKDKFAELAEISWTVLNKEWILENRVPKELIKPAINFCRIVFASYGYGLDCFSCPEEGIDASINELLVDPMVV